MKRTTRRQKIAKQNAIALFMALGAVLALWGILIITLQGV
jgi:hypothetical protein